MRDADKVTTVQCVYCGEIAEVPDRDGNYERGIFRYFCPNKGCEDKYSATL